MNDTALFFGSLLVALIASCPFIYIYHNYFDENFIERRRRNEEYRAEQEAKLQQEIHEENLLKLEIRELEKSEFFWKYYPPRPLSPQQKPYVPMEPYAEECNYLDNAHFDPTHFACRFYLRIADGNLPPEMRRKNIEQALRDGKQNVPPWRRELPHPIPIEERIAAAKRSHIYHESTESHRNRPMPTEEERQKKLREFEIKLEKERQDGYRRAEEYRELKKQMEEFEAKAALEAAAPSSWFTPFWRKKKKARFKYPESHPWKEAMDFVIEWEAKREEEEERKRGMGIRKQKPQEQEATVDMQGNGHYLDNYRETRPELWQNTPNMWFGENIVPEGKPWYIDRQRAAQKKKEEEEALKKQQEGELADKGKNKRDEFRRDSQKKGETEFLDAVQTSTDQRRLEEAPDDDIMKRSEITSIPFSITALPTESPTTSTDGPPSVSPSVSTTTHVPTELRSGEPQATPPDEPEEPFFSLSFSYSLPTNVPQSSVPTEAQGTLFPTESPTSDDADEPEEPPLSYSFSYPSERPTSLLPTKSPTGRTSLSPQGHPTDHPEEPEEPEFSFSYSFSFPSERPTTFLPTESPSGKTDQPEEPEEPEFSFSHSFSYPLETAFPTELPTTRTSEAPQVNEPEESPDSFSISLPLAGTTTYPTETPTGTVAENSKIERDAIRKTNLGQADIMLSRPAGRDGAKIGLSATNGISESNKQNRRSTHIDSSTVSIKDQGSKNSDEKTVERKWSIPSDDANEEAIVDSTALKHQAAESDITGMESSKRSETVYSATDMNEVHGKHDSSGNTQLASGMRNGTDMGEQSTAIPSSANGSISGTMDSSKLNRESENSSDEPAKNTLVTPGSDEPFWKATDSPTQSLSPLQKKKKCPLTTCDFSNLHIGKLSNDVNQTSMLRKQCHLSVSGSMANGMGNLAVSVFNSSHPTAQQLMLGSPHASCGGDPRVLGPGGSVHGPFPNCKSQGSMLVLQNPAIPSRTPSSHDKGGCLFLDFVDPVQLKNVVILSTDPGEPVVISVSCTA